MISTDNAGLWRDIEIIVRDGITLYGRHYPAPASTRRPASKRRPVLCLAGLTRNSRDFHVLATALSSAGESTRDVYTFDCRGRGLSENAPSWKDYIVPIEMLDVQDFMASQQLHGAALIGTSRGGLIAMVMAAAQPSLLGAVILNDIGPELEQEGLIRIANYVGKTPVPRTWEDATAQLKRTSGNLFPTLRDGEWADIARQWFNDDAGRPALGYDPAIARTFAFSPNAMPHLWPQFQALSHVPCLVVRGALSDLLSRETVAKMCRRHPRCSAMEVADQGHAPLLRDPKTIEALRDFLDRTDPRL